MDEQINQTKPNATKEASGSNTNGTTLKVKAF
jgi:hypothetical protein